MIRRLRARYANDPLEYADGLRAWLDGDPSDEADAAGASFVATVTIADRWLRAQFKR